MYVHMYIHMYLYVIIFVDLDIKSFMAFYRGNFPRASFPTASVLPKMHLIWWYGGVAEKIPGFMGEQGAESICVLTLTG